MDVAAYKNAASSRNISSVVRKFHSPATRSRNFLNKNANIVNTSTTATTITEMKTNAFVFAKYGAQLAATFGFASQKD